MDEKKKILLGEKDILSKDNEDLFINLNLNQTFSEIRNDKFENVFDVEKQFKKERNASRDFRIYGIIDATIADCDNLTLSAYTASYSGTGIDSGVTFFSGFVTSVTSSQLVYNGINAYGKKRGKYLIELSGYTNDFLYIKLPSNNFNYKDQYYSQQLIFRDSENNFVEYGTQTIDITESGEAIEINNDFYFLYNKHWVKKDLLITEEKPAIISFSGTPEVNVINEIPVSTFWGGPPGINPFLSSFSVVLNKPSTFGLEDVKMDILSSTINPTTELALVDELGAFVSLPHTITFNVGEQQKLFYVFSPLDYEQEFLENVVFELKDFQFVNTGSPLNHTVEVVDGDERNKVTLNFQDIFNNRNYFTGIRHRALTTSPFFSYPLPAVLRNGLKYEGTAMEFYPVDNFILKIKNVGQNTILPVNLNLGIADEQIFANGSELTFNINEQYTNTEKHSIKLYFSELSSPGGFTSLIPAAVSGITINSVPVIDYYAGNPYKFDYQTIVSALKQIPNTAFSTFNFSGWNRYNLDVPFDIFEDISNLSVTLVAKNPGTRLDLKVFGYRGTEEVLLEDDEITGLLTAQTIDAFVYSAQTPLEIILGANRTNNTEAQYEFTISKTGFENLNFTSSPLPASLLAPKYFLASSYSDMLRNWDDSTNEPVYVHAGVTSNWPTTISNGLYDSGEVYINGAVLLANKYFDRTSNTSSYISGVGTLNKTSFSNNSGDYRADFLSAPIVVIPATTEYYSPQDRAQVGFLAIASSSSLPSGANAYRSFNFKTGLTSSFTTFSTMQFDRSGFFFWNGSGAGFTATGNTATGAISHTSASLRNYLQVGVPSVSNTPQGIIGNPSYTYITPADYTAIGSVFPNSHPANDFIKLESANPGVPFEITNIIDMVESDGSLVIPTGSIHYYPFIPNENIGVTINQANNHMGGYSLTRPSTAIIPYIHKVSFEVPSYTVPMGSITVKISLDIPSTYGNESVDIIRLSTSTAISGVDYVTPTPLPVTLTWAIGEQDKFVTFVNATAPSFGAPKSLQLQLSNLINIIPGTFTNANITIF